MSISRVADPTVADWFAPRLLGRDHWATPGSIVPTGYDQVVRVLHPTADGRRWSRTARESGTLIHPRVQWRCIAAHFDPVGRGPQDPSEGSAPREMLAAILEHCPAEGDVFYGIWDGFGSWQDRPDNAAMLHIPGRDYYLFTGPKSTPMTWPGMDPFWEQSANVIWPSDRSWVVATEIDWDFTLVAGPKAMTDALLQDDRLEALPVRYTDDLTWYGDDVNPFPERMRLR